MKKFLVDQVIFLVIGIAIMILIPTFCGSIFTLIFEIVVTLCWGYLCRRILLLPFDIILGKISETVYFAAQCAIEDSEFFRDIKYCVWKFQLVNNQTLRLFVPIVIRKEDEYTVALPPKDRELRITYFRLSKILLQWNTSQR